MWCTLVLFLWKSNTKLKGLLLANLVLSTHWAQANHEPCKQESTLVPWIPHTGRLSPLPACPKTPPPQPSSDI